MISIIARKESPSHAVKKNVPSFVKKKEGNHRRKGPRCGVKRRPTSIGEREKEAGFSKRKKKTLPLHGVRKWRGYLILLPSARRPSFFHFLGKKKGGGNGAHVRPQGGCPQ